ncbi:MAG: apolipoprotein N-acyltransferase, partial [Granulosicoccus sp.]|nr:apolipoprotein N-acyltransferase [Granulosicoccus sp.]
MSVLPRWLAYTLAICSGLILPLSFAPTHWWALALLSVSILYALVQGASPRQSFWLGWLFGLGYFGIGVHWVYFSLHLFGAAIAPLAAALTLVFVLVMTLFPALCCWFWARWRGAGASNMNALLFASLWVLSELLRGKLMDGFPWILLGYSQSSGPLGDFAPLIGVYGISFLIVFTSCAMLVLLRGSMKQRAVSMASVTVVALSAWAAGSLSYSTPDGEPLDVRLVQANIAQEMKFSRERLEGAMRQYTAMTLQAGLDDIDLVVWPETAIPTYFDRVEKAFEPFVASMDARGVDILSGGFQRDGDDVYNAVRQLGGDRALYRKR